MDELLPVDAAANRLGLKRKTLDIWRGLGKGPKYLKLAGGRIFYRPADLSAWLEKQVVDPEAGEAA